MESPGWVGRLAVRAEAPSKGWLQGESLGFFLFMENLSFLTSPEGLRCRWVLLEVRAGGAAGPAGCVRGGCALVHALVLRGLRKHPSFLPAGIQAEHPPWFGTQQVLHG